MHSTMAMFVVVLALLAGCRSMTGQSLGTNVDDKTTTASVKAKLVADQLQNLTWVDVDTRAGTVYLMGTASSQAQKQRAEELARDTDGVKKVVNNIQVKAATTSSSGSSASPSAMPATSAATGRVTSIDRSSGRLTVDTSAGDLTLPVPASTLSTINVGDQVTIDVGKAR
jgi:hypothetical protein